jgi:hypothetical protein
MGKIDIQTGGILPTINNTAIEEMIAANFNKGSIFGGG